MPGPVSCDDLLEYGHSPHGNMLYLWSTLFGNSDGPCAFRSGTQAAIEKITVTNRYLIYVSVGLRCAPGPHGY